MSNHTINTCFIEHPELLIKRRQQQMEQRRSRQSQSNGQANNRSGWQSTNNTAQLNQNCRQPRTEVAAYAEVKPNAASSQQQSSQASQAYATPQTYSVVA